MSLPINLDNLINGSTVESERIEFKEGWNPIRILKTICAFANDIHNWGGGYLIIGIEEYNGRPKLPPKGLDSNNIDQYQQELVRLCQKINPHYFPVVHPVIFQDKHVLIIWTPIGYDRPYKCPSSLGRNSQLNEYIRRSASTCQANPEEIRQLREMSREVPFDNRTNHQADLKDLSLQIIQDYLLEVESLLYEDSKHISFENLCRDMNIVRGAEENLKPINIGLLMFSKNPEKYFMGAKIEIVTHHDSVGRSYTEKIFSGPIYQQLQNSLEYIQSNIIKEKIFKISGVAKSERFFNYPFEAIEEALTNAVFHRSYDHNNTIEVNILHDEIEIISYRGPLPPIDNNMLKQKRVSTRAYRNCRLGDFLKELQLTEGRATGLPTIYNTLKKNESPDPIFLTDQDRTFFLTKIKMHPAFTDFTLDDISMKILNFCINPKKRASVLEHIGLKNQRKNYKRHMLPLIEKGWLSMLLPDKPSSPKQKYVITSLAKTTITNLDKSEQS